MCESLHVRTYAPQVVCPLQHALDVKYSCFTVIFLSAAKTEELRKDIEVLSQTFERVVDCKDAVIKSLMRDIEESEGQYHRALQGHLDSVNGLVEFQLRRLQEREEAFQEEVGELQLKFDQERYVRMYVCVAQHISLYIYQFMKVRKIR